MVVAIIQTPFKSMITVQNVIESEVRYNDVRQGSVHAIMGLPGRMMITNLSMHVFRLQAVRTNIESAGGVAAGYPVALMLVFLVRKG